MKKIVTVFQVVILVTVLGLSVFMFASSGNTNFLWVNYNIKLVSAEKIERDLTRMNEVLSDEENQKSFIDFGVKILLDNYVENQNAQLSPLSLYLAASALTNATAGETQAELLSLLGMDSVEALNDYAGFIFSRYAEDKNTEGAITIGNSIWYNEAQNVNVKQNFLDLNSDYYGADIFKTEFDNNAVREINSWVNDKTRGLIPNIIQNIEPETIFYIFNALSFIQRWNCKFYGYTRENFTLSDNTTKQINFIKSGSGLYFKSDFAKAFRMYFENIRFSFVGILPDGNLNEYLEIFNKKELYTLLTNSVSNADVFTSVPQFSSEKDFSVNQSFKNLGVNKIFNLEESDFTGFSDNKIFISDIYHKSNFMLDKYGVKMAAVTYMMGATSAPSTPVERPKVYIYLDRPFIYGIIDNEYNVPIYLGICNNPF